MTWSDIKSSWDSTWDQLAQEGEELWAAAVQADPTGALLKVQAFMEALEASRANLDQMKAQVEANPELGTPEVTQALSRWETAYLNLAAGFYSDATPTGGAPKMGVAPILIVGSLGVGISAVTFALASYEYAVNLREQTAVAAAELQARVEASKEGRTLQEATVKLPDGPSVDIDNSGGGMLPWLLLLAAGGAGAWFFMNRGS